MFSHSHPAGALMGCSECLEWMNELLFPLQIHWFTQQKLFSFLLKSPGLFFLPLFCTDHRNRTSQDFNNTEGKKRRKIHKTLLFFHLHYFTCCSFCIVIFDYFPFPSFFFFWKLDRELHNSFQSIHNSSPSPFQKFDSQNSNSCVIILITTSSDFTQSCCSSDAQFL